MGSKDLSVTSLELDVAAWFFENTGKNNFWKLSPTARRKLIEEYLEEQEVNE